MLKNRGLLAGICAICILLGYLVGKKTSSVSEVDPAESITASTRASLRDSRENRRTDDSGSGIITKLLGGRDIRQVSASELKTIISDLSKRDQALDPLASAEKSYQLQLLLERLSASQLEDIASDYAIEDKASTSPGLGVVLMNLASKDSSRALNWAITQDDPSGFYETVIAGMAKNDPMTAAKLFSEGLIDGRITASAMWITTNSISTALATLGSDQLISFISTLPRRQQGNALYNTVDSIPENGRIKALEKIYRFSNEAGRDNLNFDHVFATMVRTDSRQAKEWLATVPEGEKKTELLVNTATSIYRSGNADEGLEWMRAALAQAPGNEKSLLQKSFQNMAYTNPGAIAPFAALLPEGEDFTAEDLINTARSSLHTGGSGLAVVVDAIRDPHEKANLIVDALKQAKENSYNRLNLTDLEILSRRVDEMGFGGEDTGRVQEALQEARDRTSKPAE